MRVNIYFGELKYEDIQQQVAYDIGAFFCKNKTKLCSCAIVHGDEYVCCSVSPEMTEIELCALLQIINLVSIKSENCRIQWGSSEKYNFSYSLVVGLAT